MSAETVQGKRLVVRHLAVILAISVGSLSTVMAEPAVAQVPCSSRWGVVAAHPDDDIIFMLPNLKNVLSWGICLDITFLTSGDASSSDPFYGWKREQAALADYVKIGLGISLSPTANAYQYYTGEPPLDVLQDGVHFVQRYTLNGVTPTIRVQFLRILDGNIDGGRPAGSLQQIYQNSNANVPTYKPGIGYNGASYNRTTLINMLRWLSVNANVSVLYTQDYLNLASLGASFVDHSDHLYGALFAQVAASWAGITQLIPHVGYPIQDWPEDLNGSDLSHKLGVWAVYSPRDDGAPDFPPPADSYYKWLRRQYRADTSGVTPTTAGNCAFNRYWTLSLSYYYDTWNCATGSSTHLSVTRVQGSAVDTIFDSWSSSANAVFTTSPSVYGDNLQIAAYYRNGTRLNVNYATNCGLPIRWCSATVNNSSNVASHAVGLIDKAFVLFGGIATCSDVNSGTCGWFIWKALL